MTKQDGGAVFRKRGTGLQVQVHVGRDPLTGRKRYVSQQVPGQTKASMREAKQIEARLLEEVGTGQHKGSRSRTMAELLERWLEWRPTVRPIPPTTVSSYRAAMDRYILPALGVGGQHADDLLDEVGGGPQALVVAGLLGPLTASRLPPLGIDHPNAS